MFNEYSKILGLVDNIIKQNDFLEKPLRYSATSTNAMNSSVFIIKIIIKHIIVNLDGLAILSADRVIEE